MTAFATVQKLLEMYPQSRESYNELVRNYLYYFCEWMWSKLPPVETICRAYRDVIKAYPQLWPCKEVAEAREREYDGAVATRWKSISNKKVRADLVFQ